MYLIAQYLSENVATMIAHALCIFTRSHCSLFSNFLIIQAASSMLLANMEREKELLRVFLKVSQMENKILRRMNLSSFLMVSNSWPRFIHLKMMQNERRPTVG